MLQHLDISFLPAASSLANGVDANMEIRSIEQVYHNKRSKLQSFGTLIDSQVSRRFLFNSGHLYHKR
jgi:hypothetical protein